MKIQSYKNHIRYYPPHHFIYYPVLTVFIGISIYFGFTSEQWQLWSCISVAFIFLFYLAFMMRQHYALTLQNRIVKLELRYRYFTLTGKRFENVESRLTESQLFALRFSSDTELPELVERALTKGLSANAIKRNIKDWRGDYDRV